MGSQRVNGARKGVYEVAMEHLAYYPRGTRPISYNAGNGNLHLDLLFDDHNNARRFENELRLWDTSTVHAFRGLAGRARNVQVQPAAAPPRADLERVYAQDYAHIPGQDKSPDNAASSWATVPPTSTRQLQMIERVASLPPRQGVEGAHIVAKALFETVRKDENNIIYLSRTLHQLYDGIGAEPKNTPAIVIYAETYPPPTDAFITTDLDGKPISERRYLLKVIVEADSEETKAWLHTVLRSPEDVGARKLRVFLYVRDPTAYARNLVRSRIFLFILRPSYLY